MCGASNPFLRWGRTAASWFLSGGLAMAQLSVTCDRPFLLAQEGCLLRASLPEGAGSGCRWRLRASAGSGAVLKPVSETEAWFTAPADLRDGACTVEVEAAREPSIRALLGFKVGPVDPGGSDGRQLVDGLVPDAFCPALSRFPGDPEADTGGGFPGSRAARIAFCGDAFAEAQDPAVQRLNRCWIVAGERGIQAFTQAGTAVRVPECLRPAAGYRVQAVAVRPTGLGPGPGHAPRMAYGLDRAQPDGPDPAGGEAARICALGADGIQWQWCPGEAGGVAAGRRVRDLALDREGQVFVAFSDDRGIVRIDPTGHASLHARIPDAAEAGAPAGLLAMVADPVTGDLYVGDRSGLWQVTPAGGVIPLLGMGDDPRSGLDGRSGAERPGGPSRPSHLALNGRELIIVDSSRREVHGLHLDQRRLLPILGHGAGPGGATRFGPIQCFNPGRSTTPWAVLGEVGSLAVSPAGWCLLAVDQGLATCALSSGPVGANPEPAQRPDGKSPGAWLCPSAGSASGSAGAETRGSGDPEYGQPASAEAKVDSLERFWALQRAIRNHEKKLQRLRGLRHGTKAASLPRRIRKHKQELRRLRRTAAALRGTAAVRSEPPPPPFATEVAAFPGGPQRTAKGHRPARVAGVWVLALLVLGSLSEPALAQNGHASPYLSSSYYSSDGPFPFDSAHSSWGGPGATGGIAAGYAAAIAGLDQLRPACAAPLVAVLDVPACSPGYQDGVLAQANAVHEEALRLLVDPATLGAGQCRRGESPTEAKERIALAQSDQLAEFDQLSADAGALWYQILRDSYALQAVGVGLLAGQAAALPMRANASFPATIPALVLGEVGNSLVAAASGMAAGSEVYGVLASEAVAYRARYQRWANSRNRALLNCSATASGGVPDAASVSPAAVPSPLPAMADALSRLETGCVLAGRHGLALPVCAPASLQAFRARNGTLSNLYRQGIPCLASGVLMGIQAPCPREPLADSRDRSDTFAYLDEFAAEISAASVATFAIGYGLFAGSEGLTVAGDAAAASAASSVAKGLVASADALIVSADVLFADGYDLLRVASAMRGVQATVIREFNAESRARLDRREVQSSSSGAGRVPTIEPGPSGASPGTAGEVEGATGTPLPDPSGAGQEPCRSAALRTRPGWAWPRLLTWPFGLSWSSW